MKRFVFGLLATLVLALPGLAKQYPLGVSLFSGYDVPVLQDDQANGPMYGLAVRGNIWKFLHGELYYRGTSQGDKDQDRDFGNGVTETITYKGGTITGFGFNLLFAHKDPCNIWPYGMLGVSSNSLKPGSDFKKDETLTGWTVGGGLGINLYARALYLDVNTYLLHMPFHNDKASRKNWQSRVGIQYFIPIQMGGN